MMTRPYISSSNYIKKMSDYKKEDWFNNWDALYWFFIYTHKELLKKIYSIQTQIKLLEKMDQTKLNNYIKTSKDLLTY
jgi:deoxyribodipyrimidine photolyase-related protein